MFLENTVNHTEQFGWIEVICGSMFSGKTEELIRRLKRAQFAKQRIEIFKPIVDTRYDDEMVVSHDANEIRSTPVPVASNIRLLANDVDVVGIDEAQFFDDEIVSVCNDLANRGIRVIVAGLDMDFKGNPFGPMPALMATAEYVTKVNAVCTRIIWAMYVKSEIVISEATAVSFRSSISKFPKVGIMIGIACGIITYLYLL